MWTEPTANIKCPRGDCAHYQCLEDAAPCKGCTCNQKSEGSGRSFRYQPKGLPEIGRKEEKRDSRTD